MVARKFSYPQQEYAKQIVRECVLSRFTVEESVAYLKTKLKRQDIDDRTYYRLRRSLRDDTEKWMKTLMQNRWAYVAQYKERIDEYLKYQKEYWLNYHSNPNNAIVRVKCLDGLQNTSAAITQLMDILPEIAGGQFESVKDSLPKVAEETAREVKAAKPTAWTA